MSRRFADFFLSLVAPAVFAFGSLFGFRSPELVAEHGLAELATGAVDAIHPQSIDASVTSPDTSHNADLSAHVLAPPLKLFDATDIAPVTMDIAGVQDAAPAVLVELVGDAVVRGVGDVTAILPVPSNAKIINSDVDLAPIEQGELPLDVGQSSVNATPIAASDSFVVDEDGRVSINVLVNDHDIDGGVLTVTAVDGQALTDGGPDVRVGNGSVGLLQGQLVFTPTPDANGPAAFTYTISDGDLTSSATVEGVINAAPKPVVASVDTVLGANDTSLILTGSAPLKGTGNALDNVITGNDGANVLDGGAGNDTMAGGLGDDTYIVDSPNDIVRELAGQGVDEVRASGSYSLPSHVEKLTLIGGGHIAAVGNDIANTITGNAGNNVIDAGGGNDTVAAGAGDDIVSGGAGNDTLSGQDGNDTLNGNDGVDLINGGAGVDVIDGGAGNDGLYGGGSDDRINGGIGNDIIFGDGGNDVVRGGPGSDTLSGGQSGNTLSAGQDTFIWLREDVIDANGRSAGLDKITDFGVGDRLDFSGLFSSPPQLPIADLVRLEDTISGTLVSVNADLDGKFWEAVVLANVHEPTVVSFLDHHFVIV